MDIHRFRSLIFITTIIGGATSHYEETYNGHTFTLPTDEDMESPLAITFSKAKEWCVNNRPGSTLPRIIEDRDSILHFIQSAVSTNRLNNGQTVLVNGIQHTRGNWSWINGHDIKDIEVRPVSGDDRVNIYNYGYLWTGGEYSIYASRPTDLRNYICEFANLSSCSSDMIISHKCYRKRNARRTWFEARNRCLTENGDLASFETLSDTTLNASLQNLIGDDREGYWIGIHRNLLHLDDKGSEIKFINWTDGHRSDVNAKCLCLGVSIAFRWIECDCEDSYPFICIRRAATTRAETSDQMTQSIELPSTHSVIISAPIIPPTAALSTMISTIDQSAPNNTNAVIGAVVSCVIIVVVVIILVVIFIIRKKRNRSKTTATTNEVSIYEELQERSGNHSIYATIQPTTSDI